MHSPKKKIACFDLGGVVVRIRRTYPEMFAAAGIDEDRLAATDFDALGPAATALGRKHQRGEIKGDEYLDRLAGLCEGLATQGGSPPASPTPTISTGERCSNFPRSK